MHNQNAPRNTQPDPSGFAISQNLTRQVMSSIEIAELTGKAHKNVLADVRKMLDELELQWAEFSAHYKDDRGREKPCFHLDRELTDTLLTGYSAKMRLAVVRRWRELEDQVQQPRVAGTNGMSCKPNDFQGAWSCSACHDHVDGRSASRRGADREEARLLHAEGVMRTQDILIREGKVAS